MHIYRMLLNYSSKIAIQHQVRYFSNTSKLCSFYEQDDRGGFEYPRFDDKPWKEHLKDGKRIFFEECKKFWQETKDHLQQDRKMYQHGDTDVFWRFDSEECLKQWRVSSDKTNKEGQSECSLIINDNKKAVFSGHVDLSLPKDGKKNFAGYCTMKSVKKTRSFFRDSTYLFDMFTHLELRVRGDGRNYAVHLGVLRYFDVQWYAMYTYSLYTHGGPYWQTIRIPFSKFFLQSKGRIQDQQGPPCVKDVNCIAIGCAGVAGPFKLEIDYIGAHLDTTHKEISAYEMYKIPKEYVST